MRSERTRPSAGAGRALLGLLAFAAIATGPQRARAASSAAEGGAVYELRLGLDVPLLAAGALTGSVWLLRSELAPPWCAPSCDPATLPAFDRAAAGRFSPAARTVSDLSVAGLLAGSASILLLDGG